MNHEHDTHCKCKSTVAAQSLDEMDFERGIWSAGIVFDNSIKNINVDFLKDKFINDTLCSLNSSLQ